MKEIGGYIEFETYRGKMLHDDGIKLNCGRNCLAYLILARNIKKLVLPYFMCDTVFDVCREYGVSMRFYHVNASFQPEDCEPAEDEWLYLMSFYGQMTSEQLQSYVNTYERVIVDFTHDYFAQPVFGADTIYTCRKFFGVPDGAVLYTDAQLPETELETDESFDRIRYLLGRFERTASEFYGESVSNNESFINSPIKKMSRLTENLLRGIDYEQAKKRRTENFAYLNDRLKDKNQLKLRLSEGAFAYPLMVDNGENLKKKLIAKKIYIPTLWPNVLDDMDEDTLEYRMANNILPLPCDHRYTVDDMEYVLNCIRGSELSD